MDLADDGEGDLEAADDADNDLPVLGAPLAFLEEEGVEGSG